MKLKVFNKEGKYIYDADITLENIHKYHDLMFNVDPLSIELSPQELELVLKGNIMLEIGGRDYLNRYFIGSEEEMFNTLDELRPGYSIRLTNFNEEIMRTDHIRCRSDLLKIVDLWRIIHNVKIELIKS